MPTKEKTLEELLEECGTPIVLANLNTAYEHPWSALSGQIFASGDSAREALINLLKRK